MKFIYQCAIFCAIPLSIISLAATNNSALSEGDSPEAVDVRKLCRVESLENLPIADLSPPHVTPIGKTSDGLWRTTQPYNPPIGHSQVYKGIYGHNGEDLGGDYKAKNSTTEDVRSVFDGKVIASTYIGGWGNSIAIASRINLESDAIITTHFHHLQERYVGDELCDAEVDAGDPVGIEGNTGDNWDKHLHFTVRYWANPDHLNKWIDEGAEALFGYGGYFGHDGKKFRGSYTPDSAGSNIDYSSPYIHYGHLDPEPLMKDYFLDYGEGSVDPNAPYAWSSEYAKKMRYYGIDMGEWNGEFGAALSTKRREAARWLRIALGGQFSGISPVEPIFADVLSNDPDFSYIQDLTQYPLSRPVVKPSSFFNPDDQINRAESLKMVVLSFYPNEYFYFWHSIFWTQELLPAALADLLGVSLPDLFDDVAISDWYASYVYFGVISGLVTLQPSFNPGAPVTRAEMSKWVILGYERLHGEGVVDPCSGVSCSSGEYCAPDSGTCMANSECIPTVNEACPVGGGVVMGSCPNSVCDSNEDCLSCPQDCGSCPASCSDGQCNGNETCQTCPQDCGTCPASCSDGQCNGNETCQTCPQDCGVCPPSCPDGQCNGNETCDSCPQDCGVCPCQAQDYWSPTFDSDVDNTGLQSNGTINTAIEVQVRQSGLGLETRVCKPGGTFSNNVAFHIYDGASNKAWVEAANLGTANSQCSGWMGLNNDTSYIDGEQFGGIWQMVSPASSAADWNWPASSCSVTGNPTGTCWNGVNITMTRTCK